MPINLGSGAISAAYVGSTAVSAAYLGSSSVYTAGGGGITPNTDGIARFYLPAASTSFTVGVATTSSYWKMTDGTNTSAVIGNGYQFASAYYHASFHVSFVTTLSGLGSSAKVVQVISCDASGNPSGNIRSINLRSNTTDIDAIDISGLGYIWALTAYSSSAYGGNYLGPGGAAKASSSLPGNVGEIRSVNTAITYPIGGVTTYYGQLRYDNYGLDISGQNLDATALDQLYTDLADATSYGGNNPLKVRSNPGTGGDTPSIATAKNYTVYGS